MAKEDDVMKKTAKPPRAPSYPGHSPVKSHLNPRKSGKHSPFSGNGKSGRSFLSKLFDLLKR
jgi:hypothetical protein